MDKENKILNPITGRYVLKSGKIGKELLKNNKIITNKCDSLKIKICEKASKICNVNTGRCNKKILPKKESPKKILPKKESPKKININKLKEEWKNIYYNSNESSLDIIKYTRFILIFSSYMVYPP